MTIRDTLRSLAFDNHGVVTTSAAAKEGVPAVEMRKLASRGALRREGYGVYRMQEVPATRMTEYARAVALVGTDAALADESVLAAHGLALVDPPRIKVATGRRVRVSLPDTVEMVPHTPVEHPSWIEGVPAMPLSAALLRCRGRVTTDRLREATNRAVELRLMDPRDAEVVLEELGRSR